MSKIKFIIVAMILFSSCTQSIIPGEYLEATTPIDSVVTYENQVKSIVSQHCVACHGGNNPKGNLRLENYKQLRNSVEFGSLIQRINDRNNPMPPSGLLPLQSRLIFESWIQNNYKEN